MFKWFSVGCLTVILKGENHDAIKHEIQPLPNDQ